MAPLRGWMARGKRLIGKAPHGHWRTLTFLAALRCDRIEAPCVFDGPINAARFLAYVQSFLLPTLKPGDVVVTATNFVRAGTIWAAIRAKPFARPSAAPVQSCSFYRLTRPT
jgi:transposase